MEIIEEIKNRITMQQLLESYGIFPVRGRNIYRCCFHPDDNPSANIVKGCEKFHCFSENKTWDIFDFVQEMEKCDLKTATKILDDKFGLGLLRELTHKEKLEFARQRKERERAKAKKLAWEQFEKETLNRIVDRIRFWEAIQKQTHITRGQFRSGNWELADLFFHSLKELQWLNWLYSIICESDYPDCEFYYIYPTNKKQILEMIKKGEIEVW